MSFAIFLARLIVSRFIFIHPARDIAFSALLAAVMMMSTAATIAASAADTNTVVKMNTTAATAQANVLDPTFNLNSDLLKTKNVTTATIFKVLEGTTKYGKYFTPVLGFITDLVFGPRKTRHSKSSMI